MAIILKYFHLKKLCVRASQKWEQLPDICLHKLYQHNVIKEVVLLFAISSARIYGLQATGKMWMNNASVKAGKEPKIPYISNYSPKHSKLDSIE